MPWALLAGYTPPSQLAAQDHQGHAADGYHGAQHKPAVYVLLDREEQRRQDEGEQRIGGYDGRHHHHLGTLQGEVGAVDAGGRCEPRQPGIDQEPRRLARHRDGRHRLPGRHGRDQQHPEQQADGGDHQRRRVVEGQRSHHHVCRAVAAGGPEGQQVANQGGAAGGAVPADGLFDVPAQGGGQPEDDHDGADGNYPVGPFPGDRDGQYGGEDGRCAHDGARAGCANSSNCQVRQVASAQEVECAQHHAPGQHDQGQGGEIGEGEYDGQDPGGSEAGNEGDEDDGHGTGPAHPQAGEDGGAAEANDGQERQSNGGHESLAIRAIFGVILCRPVRQV